MGDTSSSSAVGGNQEVTYNFATRGDDDIDLEDEESTATRSSDSRVVEEMSKKEIEDTEPRAPAPEGRKNKPTPEKSDEKYDLYGKRFDEWAHDLSVVRRGYVSDLGVKPEWQKQNVEAGLFADFEAYAEECNMGLLFLVDKK
ncbi:hypothetical protein DL768_011842 [Monosporascus sp. mg162]|nr:hypothetical protein DL768_011842 [Monosporascus sp. mg162]